MKLLALKIAFFSACLVASPAYAQSGTFPGDYDGDGVISLADFAVLHGCFAGPDTGPVTPECAPGDFDVDADMDVREVQSFQNQFSAQECTYSPFNYQIWQIDTMRTVKSADMNNDGIPDVLSTNSSSLSITLGLGHAQFALPVVYQIAQISVVIDVGDIDADGNLDVVAGRSPTRFDITIFRGNGRGALVEQESYHFPGFVGLPTLNDVDSNGTPDIIAWTEDGIASLLNDGTGSFGEPIYSVLPVADKLRLADLNGDGRSDIVGRSPGAAGFAVAFGNGDGSFVNSTQYYGGTVAGVPALEDMNHDGITDIVAILESVNDIVVLTGDGTGHFVEIWRHSFTHHPRTIAIADVNHDSNLDILAIAANGISVLLGDGTGSHQLFSTYWPRLGEFLFPDLTLADINGDSHLDILASRGYLGFLLGYGDGSFSAPMSYDIDADNIAIDDFDGDGDLDVAAFDYHDISILVNDHEGQLDLTSTIEVSTTSTSNMISADLNNDGDPDLLWVSWAQLFTMQGKEGSDFEEPVPYPIGSGATTLTTADHNGDGIRDVIAGQGERLLIIPGIGDGALGALTALEMGGAVSDIGAYDINFDGRDELFVLNKTIGELVVLMAHEDEGWSQVAVETTLDVPVNLYLDDVSGDNILDVIITKSGQVGIHLGRGYGSFDPVAIMETEGTHPAAAISDVDGDSRVDIVLTRPNDGVDTYYGLGNGQFQFGGESSFLFVWVNGLRKSIVACDMNNDDRPDLVSFESQSISVMLNKCGF